MKPIDNNLIIQEIVEGDETTLRALYPRYQVVFMRTIREAWRDTFDEETMIEAYLEAIANFYIRVKSKKLTHLNNTVESYLIATGKYWLIRETQRKNLTVPIDISITEPIDDENFLTQTTASELDEGRKARLRDAFEQLGKKCKQLLNLSFWEDKSTEEIMDSMGYANLNTLYAAKARCIKDLKELIKK